MRSDLARFCPLWSPHALRSFGSTLVLAFVLGIGLAAIPASGEAQPQADEAGISHSASFQPGAPPSVRFALADRLEAPARAPVATGTDAWSAWLIWGRPARTGFPPAYLQVLGPVRSDSTRPITLHSVALPPRPNVSTGAEAPSRRVGVDTVDVGLEGRPGEVARLEVRLLLGEDVSSPDDAKASDADRSVAGRLLYRWLGPESASSARAAPVFQPDPRAGAIRAGAPVPAFTVQFLDGTTIRSQDFAGQAVVVNWWHHACAPCIAEIPGLSRLAERYADREDVMFLAVANSEPDAVQMVLERWDFSYRQALATKGTETTFGLTYPRHVIIDASGTVVYDETGGHENVYREIERALRTHIFNGD